MHFQSFNYNRNIVSKPGKQEQISLRSFLSFSFPASRSSTCTLNSCSPRDSNVRSPLSSMPSWRTLGKNWRCDERHTKLFGEKMMKQPQMKHKWKNIWSWDFWNLDPAIFCSSGIRAATRFPLQLGWHKRASCARQVLKDFFVMKF